MRSTDAWSLRPAPFTSRHQAWPSLPLRWRTASTIIHTVPTRQPASLRVSINRAYARISDSGLHIAPWSLWSRGREPLPGDGR